MAKSGSINLLPQEEFAASTLGRILKWATGSFRIIVIITEMVVMGAFLSRFWLDAQNSDLNDSINIKSAQISSQKDFETKFRGVQTKLDIFKNINGGPQLSDKLDLITTKIPADVTLSAISVSAASSEIKGVSVSEMGIAQFISNLKAEKSFKTVEIGGINSSQSNPADTEFSVRITF